MIPNPDGVTGPHQRGAGGALMHVCLHPRGSEMCMKPEGDPPLSNAKANPGVSRLLLFHSPPPHPQTAFSLPDTC